MGLTSSPASPFSPGGPGSPGSPCGDKHLSISGPRSPQPSPGLGSPGLGPPALLWREAGEDTYLISGGPCAPLPPRLPVSSRLSLERPGGLATPSPSWASDPVPSSLTQTPGLPHHPCLYTTAGCTPTGSTVLRAAQVPGR